VVLAVGAVCPGKLDALRRKRCNVGTPRPVTTSFFPGKPPKSLRIGSASRRTPRTVWAFPKSGFHFCRRKQAPILFQLPQHFETDDGRLTAFLELLTRKRRYCFEFRHPSWYAPRIFRLLQKYNIALCLSDHHDAPAPWKQTADFVYIRGHGPSGRYRGRYATSTLEQWRVVFESGESSTMFMSILTTIRRAPHRPTR
jgi:uncharacterized protein YecE (DUF72 family)